MSATSAFAPIDDAQRIRPRPMSPCAPRHCQRILVVHLPKRRLRPRFLIVVPSAQITASTCHHAAVVGNASKATVGFSNRACRRSSARRVGAITRSIPASANACRSTAYPTNPVAPTSRSVFIVRHLSTHLSARQLPAAPVLLHAQPLPHALHPLLPQPLPGPSRSRSPRPCRCDLPRPRATRPHAPRAKRAHHPAHPPPLRDCAARAHDP